MMKIEELLDSIANYSNNRGNFITDKVFITNTFFYILSVKLSHSRHKILIQNELGEIVKESDLKFYTLMFNSSGAGKDFTLKNMKKLLDLDETRANNFIKKKLLNIYENLETPDDYREFPNIISPLSGTPEGLFKVVKAINLAQMNVNLVSSEILDYITKSDIAFSLKELYDGELLPKITSGKKLEQKLENIISNFCGFGSSQKLSSSDMLDFVRGLLSSGLNRRCFTLAVKPKPLIIRKKRLKVDNSLLELLLTNIKTFNLLDEHSILIKNDNYKYIFDEIVEFANENYLDEMFSSEAGSMEKIMILSVLSSIACGRLGEPNSGDIEFAFEHYKLCRATTEELLRWKSTATLIYELLLNYGSMFKSEILERLKLSKRLFNDNIDTVAEKAELNGKVLEIRVFENSNIIRYEIKQ